MNSSSILLLYLLRSDSICKNFLYLHLNHTTVFFRAVFFVPFVPSFRSSLCFDRIQCHWSLSLRGISKVFIKPFDVALKIPWSHTCPTVKRHILKVSMSRSINSLALPSVGPPFWTLHAGFLLVIVLLQFYTMLGPSILHCCSNIMLQ